MPLFETRTADLIARVGEILRDYISGTATGGNTTTVIDSSRYEVDDYFQNTAPPSRVRILTTTDNAAPKGEERTVTDFAQSTGTFTVGLAFTASLTSGDTYCVMSEYKYTEVLQALNDAINSVKRRAVVEKIDHSVQIVADVYEYDVPAGFTHIYRISMADSAGNYPEEIPPDQYRIIRGTPTPRIQFIRYPNEALPKEIYVGELWADAEIEDGRTLRIEGYGYQDTLVDPNDLCYLEPTFLSYLAAAMLHARRITRADTDPDEHRTQFQVCMQVAKENQPSAVVMFPPNTKRIYV